MICSTVNIKTGWLNQPQVFECVSTMDKVDEKIFRKGMWIYYMGHIYNKAKAHRDEKLNKIEHEKSLNFLDFDDSKWFADIPVPDVEIEDET